VVLLPDGSVLEAGGSINGNILVASAEVYFPQEPPFDRSVFVGTGNTAVARQLQTATVLPNGKVLVAGGVDVSGSIPFSSAELYNPLSGTFSPSAGNMSSPRVYDTATLLPNGKVLVAGGQDFFSNGGLASADLYDPSTDTFAPTGNMNGARSTQTATLLPNGKVLIAGGSGAFGVTATAELYDPASGLFSMTGSMSVFRFRHTATLLPNGKVLIAGGAGNASAELYDPAAGTFTATGSMSTPRDSATATLLPNGKVLVAGGVYIQAGIFLSSAELYDPATGTFSVTGSLGTGRELASAVLLPNGKALVIGGLNPSNPNGLSSAEVYDPTTGLFSPAGNMQVVRAQFTATLLPSGTVLTVGGSGDTTADLFGPGPSLSLPAYNCNLESTLHSITGTTTAAIEFLNSSGITQNVYWLTYAGTRQLYLTLAPGQSFVQGTFLTHPWVATDSSNTCRAIYLPTLESGVAVLF
jgi:hypothetical protein